MGSRVDQSILAGPVYTIVPSCDLRTVTSSTYVCVYGHRYGPLGGAGPYVRKKDKIAKTWVGPVTTRTRGVDYTHAITDGVQQRL